MQMPHSISPGLRPWSSPSPSRKKNAIVPLEPPPYRVPQPFRPGQPAARVGPFQLSSPAPASTRKKVVATASRRKTTASNNLDPLSRARPWSALPRCCVNIAVRVAPTEQASRASLFHGHGAGAVCLGFAAMAPPGAAEEGARSRCLRRPTTTMPGGGRAVKTGRTRPCPMPIRSRDGMSKAPAIYCRGRADEVRGDEATYLSMTVRHGHSRRARRPLATASLFSAAPPRPVAVCNPYVRVSPLPA